MMHAHNQRDDPDDRIALWIGLWLAVFTVAIAGVLFGLLCIEAGRY